MNLRRAALISLAVNAILLFAATHPRHLGITVSSTDRNSGIQRAAAAAAPENLKREPMLWSSIERSDLKIYAANMRKLGFPEGVVQNVIVTEIDRNFTARWAAKSVRTNFWKTADPTFRERAQKRQARRDLETERRVLIKNVLGVPWYQTAPVLWGDLTGFVLSTFLTSEEKTDAIAGLWVKFMDMKRDLRDVDLVLPEDGDRQRQASDEMMRDLTSILSPAEVEEVGLRMAGGAIGDVWSAQALFGCDLTGPELRELLRIKKGTAQPLTEIFGAPPEPSQEEVTLQENQLRQFLGNDRFQGYLRAKNQDFRRIARATSDLPIEKTWAIYDIYRAANDSAVRINEDQGLATDQREMQLKSLRNETEGSLGKALGEEKFQSYLKRNPTWARDWIEKATPKR